jgi:hypothetical protein
MHPSINTKVKNFLVISRFIIFVCKDTTIISRITNKSMFFLKYFLLWPNDQNDRKEKRE